MCGQAAVLLGTLLGVAEDQEPARHETLGEIPQAPDRFIDFPTMLLESKLIGWIRNVRQPLLLRRSACGCQPSQTGRNLVLINGIRLSNKYIQL